jgi:hypothetical protein
MPYREEKRWIPPRREKRDDAKLGNTSVWSLVERAKDAGVPEVQGWRRNKTVGSAAEELDVTGKVNRIRDALKDRIRKRKARR